MESIIPKHYHDDDFDAIIILQHFAVIENNELAQELIEFPQHKLHHVYTSGVVSGDTLIDVSAGPIFCGLIAACDVVKEITILESSVSAIMETELWLKSSPKCYDWSHVINHLCNLEGAGVTYEEKELKVKNIVKRVLKCDFTKENPTDPVQLPKADILYSFLYLDVVCKTLDEYCSKLKNMSSLLKLGGQFLLFGLFNGSRCKLDQHELSMLNYDEKFLREVLSDNGYKIQDFEVFNRKNSEKLDHEYVFFVLACKERES